MARVAYTRAHGCGRATTSGRIQQLYTCPRLTRDSRGSRDARCAAAPAPSAEPLVTVDSVSKSHDGVKILFEDLSFTLPRGGRLAVIGANGSGKTSLLRLIAGSDWPDDGTVVVRKGTQIGFLTQDAELPESCSALDAVVQAEGPMAAAVRNYNRLLAQGAAADAQETEKSLNEMNAFGGWELEEKAKEVLEAVGIPDATMNVEEMSGGQRRKVTVAAALLGAPDVIILDEPTNHMDVQFIKWMEKTIRSEKMTLVLVTHDRAFMEGTCNEILELDNGRGYLHPIGGEGSYAEYRHRRAERRKAQAAAAADARTVLRKETEWMAKQPRARQAKSKARIQSFYDLSAKAQALPKVDLRVSFGDVQMARQGKTVLIMNDCTKLWEGRPIIEGFTYEFNPGERIGIVGRNGSGKSTLLDMIAGKLELDSGVRRLGDTTVVGYFAQHTPPVNPKLRIIDYVKGVADASATASVLTDVDWGMKPDKMLESLGFAYPQQRQLVSSLSGGERRRLHLASILALKPNFLILDEPTNDLDLATIETLEALLDSYSGCVIVVSHDKAFMERATDRMFMLEGDGEVKLFDGDYSDYVAYVDARILRDEEDAAARGKRDESAERERQAAAGPSSHATAVAVEEKKPLRLGFREKEEVAKLEALVDKLSAEKDALEAEVEAQAQAGDFGAVHALTERLHALSATLEEKTERWLDLAERAELAGTV